MHAVCEQIMSRQPTGLGEAASHLRRQASEGGMPARPWSLAPTPLDPRPGLWVDAHDVSPAWDAPTRLPPTSSQQASKELAMHIGEDQQEYEILPEEDQPVTVPEPEPPRQPEGTPA